MFLLYPCVYNHDRISVFGRNAVLSYAVDALGVKHVIVMGHYGCGGVAASMVPPPPVPLKTAQVAVQDWIQPIRDVYLTSTRYALCHPSGK